MRNWNLKSALPLISARVNLLLTYEELKSSKSQSKSKYAVTIYYLPMRNWNINMVTDETDAILIYYLPMRNWNAKGTLLHKADDGIYYLPMRNWNLHTETTLNRTETIYYLPMRNWNSAEKNSIIEPFGFILTYEELKF